MLTRRERLRAATIDDIKATAMRQIAAEGPAALSLRGIAREIGVTPPALYRYYPSRDDLVTALIVDAFNSFASALEAERDGCAPDDHRARFKAVCLAYFRWARKNAQAYAVIFGAPPPGYHLAEPAYPAARRGFLALLDTVGAAQAAGKLSGASIFAPLPPPLRERYAALQAAGMPYSATAVHLALTIWSAMHGVTALALNGALDSFLGTDVESFVDGRIDGMMQALGLA